MAVGFIYKYEVEDLRGGDEEVVEDLFFRYRDKLLRMIAVRLDTRVLSKVEIEDVLQEVFVSVARGIRRYLDRPTVHVLVWLRRIATQVLIDTHRKYLGARMRDPSKEVDLDWGASADGSCGLFVAKLADTLTTPSQCMVRQEATAAVRGMLEKLDPIDRQVLVLRHLEELSNVEVAQILDIECSAASKRYLRALERLRDMMPAER